MASQGTGMDRYGSSKTGDLSLDSLAQSLESRCQQRSSLQVHRDEIHLYETIPVDSGINYQTYYNRACYSIKKTRLRVHQWWTSHSRYILWSVIAICLLGYAGYFGYAMYLDYKGGTWLIVLTALTCLLFLQYVIRLWYGTRINCRLRTFQEKATPLWKKYLRWICLGLAILGFLVFIGIDVRAQPKRLISIPGSFAFILISVIFSKFPAKIPWNLVCCGFLAQIVLGIFVIRFKHGLWIFEQAGKVITDILAFTDQGSLLVFGENFRMHELVFQVLMTVIFFGSLVSAMYYLGIIQAIIRVLGRVMLLVMDVTPAEAFVAAANIFLGPNISVLTIAPLVGQMTKSELHCVMTCGFATVTGSLLGAYTGFGVPVSHLISASVMSAPAALIMSKVFFPESEESSVATLEDLNFPKLHEWNVFESIYVGAVECVKIVAHIIVNLLAFVSFLAVFNDVLFWFGARVGIESVSFQSICSYLFVPIALFMGIELADCREVARLIGTKLVMTDIVAYMELGQLIKNRQAGLLPAMSERSEVIATYALCGFGNFGDIGICLGAIGAIVPHRKSDLAEVSLRAMVAGNFACFLTACVAGLLYLEK